jgi:quercetin dioxygenase-like cupin family protein
VRFPDRSAGGGHAHETCNARTVHAVAFDSARAEVLNRVDDAYLMQRESRAFRSNIHLPDWHATCVIDMIEISKVRYQMKINRSCPIPSSIATAENFTGIVRRDGLIRSEVPGRVGTGVVTFEPGARTAWHTHPVGQILIITAGRGWVRSAGQQRYEVTAGDSVWIPANERHWHGATDTTFMTHIAITETVDGSAVTWQEHVSDEQYVRG